MAIELEENIITKNKEVREALLRQDRGNYFNEEKVLNPKMSKQTRLEEEGIPHRERLVSRNQDRAGKTYLDYFSRSYGEDDSFTDFMTQLLSGMNPEYALRETRVGVVDSPRVFNALNGVITTNPNYTTYGKIENVAKDIWNGEFDIIKDLGDTGSDTRLGKITNVIYPRMLFYASKVNSARGRYSKENGHPYLTPKLYMEYGNNSATVARLSDILWVDSRTGRTRDDFSSLAHVMSYDEAVASTDLGYRDLLTEQFDVAKNEFNQQYNPQRGKNYYGFVNNEYSVDNVFENNIADGINFETNYSGRIGDESRAVRKVTHHIYDEGDEVLTTRVDSKIDVKVDENGDPIHGSLENNPQETTKQGLNAYLEGDPYEFDRFVSLNNDDPINKLGTNNLLAKTKRLFNSHKINTMIGRFHTKGGSEPSNDSAYDPAFGNSHGRSLKKLDANFNGDKNKTNGYSDPYCRVWTYHHQYAQYKNTIRPFIYTDENGEERNFTIKEIQDNVESQRAVISDGIETGAEYLDGYSVLGNNGFVKIGPYEEDYADVFGTQLGHKEHTDTKKNKHLYMLSIENLAWKDFPHGIEKMRIGPNGGRIMWFPPYDLKFNENVAVEWGNNAFIGRGEKVYTYSNTTRTAQLGFTILIDHPSVLDELKFKNHQGYGLDSDVDGDILRYFAGCHNFIFKTDSNEGEHDKPEKTVYEIGEEPQDGHTIRFAVFFPNNYSGNMVIPSGSGKADRKNAILTNGCTDNDWWYYLLFGHNISVTDVSNEIGYETSSNGISDMSSLIMSDKTKVIYACNTKCDADYEICNTESPDKRRRFRYRVDFDLKQNALNYKEGQSLDVLNNDSYVDSKSYQLNVDESAVKAASGRFANVDCSFGVFMAALLKVKNDVEYQHVLDKLISVMPSVDVASKVNSIANILSNNVINKIDVKGGATEQDSGNTHELATRRTRTVIQTVSDMLPNYTRASNNSSESTFDFKGKGENISKSDDINTVIAKSQRCALVTITYGKAETVNTGNDDVPNNEENKSGDGEYGVNGKSSTNTDKKAKGIDNRTHYLTGKLNGSVNYEADTAKTMTGYEYEYFSRLEKDDPVVFKMIHDKYKYFDPSFHSMSPEGFNARLNFLQQCTRQGHTISASDVNGTSKAAPTAGNLAFGRMPVCVLRIGDFIYSRFIIDSMSIDYSTDGITWDLNPEGAGVQPMFAKVEMGITLLGGSSLVAPINRLQNAQTFDYYANTGVYDPRADRIEIGQDGVLYKHLYTPYESNK